VIANIGSIGSKKQVVIAQTQFIKELRPSNDTINFFASFGEIATIFPYFCQFIIGKYGALQYNLILLRAISIQV
jgi:hypothetical protein